MSPPQMNDCANARHKGRRYVEQSGVHNGAFGVDKFGLKNLKAVHWNLGTAALYEHALQNYEADLTREGALCAETGEFTGRSPKDKFTVRDALTDATMSWSTNQSITPEQFAALHADFLKHAEGMTLYAQDLHGGADPKFQIKVRVYTEFAWHSLFIRTLLRRPETAELAGFVPELTLIDLPSFRADPKRHGCKSENVVAIDFTRKIVLIGGSQYAGEMKKSVFTTLNFYLPEQGVGPDGVFNFEGGCYAKTIRLSREAEPAIYDASLRFGAILENVAVDPQTREVDFNDGSKTENTRSAYPLDAIPNASTTGRAGQPKNIVMLAADAFGVLPPIAKLTPSQAMYHFLSGYTAKVAGTERGLGNEPQPEFSPCFGSPFLPRDPTVYGKMLRELIAKHHVECWQVHTGWTGAKFRTDPYFGFAVPTALPGGPSDILDPVNTWADKTEFAKTAQGLVGMFQKNFAKFEKLVDADVLAAAPED